MLPAPAINETDATNPVASTLARGKRGQKKLNARCADNSLKLKDMFERAKEKKAAGSAPNGTTP